MLRINDLRTKQFKYVVVEETKWRRYGKYTYVEPQQLCSSMSEAIFVKSSFMKDDGKRYVIVEKERIFPVQKKTPYQQYQEFMRTGKWKKQ